MPKKIYLETSVSRRVCWWFLRGLLPFIVCCGLFNQASADALADGRAWLAAQVQADGSVAQEQGSMALPLQLRSEVATTLRRIGAAVPVPLSSTIAQQAPDTTEYHARQALSALQSGSAATSHLDWLQANASQATQAGGFGATPEHAANVQDTAWALLALKAGRANAPEVNDAIGWLLGNQQSDGSWKLAQDEDSLIPTAWAVQALQEVRSVSGVATALAKARQWIHAQRLANGAWGSTERTAQALLALLPAQADASGQVNAIAALEAAQLGNGSWQDDAYTTALALRALWLAAQPATNPDAASVQGTVVDDATGAPIAGAQASLQTHGLHATTDANGQFAFPQLGAGAETLTIQAAGYLTLTTELPLQRGQALDMGSIRLKALSGANATTVTITGVATYSDDGVTYHNAANAVIQVGALAATTNASGAYVLENVAPGAIALNASYATYPAIDVNFTAQAGQQVRFNPQFVRTSGQNTLRVTVSDQATGLAIASANVALNGIQRATNASGEVYFATGVEAGDNTVAVSANGYDSRIVTLNVQGINTIRLPVALAPADPAAPAQTILKGTITDAHALLPLAGASVKIDGTSHAATTNAQGNYEISGAPDFSGARRLIVEKAGYQSHEQTVTITVNRTHQFDVPLQPQVDTSQPIQMVVTVLNRDTHAPIAGATVSLSGSNPHTGQTSATGEAEFAALNAGTTQLLVAAAGYDNAAVSVNLAAGHRYQVPIELTPQVVGSDRIYGKVLDAQSRQPLAGVEVTLGGIGAYTATTDAQGNYEFANLPLGHWNVSAIVAGYKGVSIGFDMVASTQVNIPLPLDFGINTAESQLRAIAVGHPNVTSAAVGYLFVFGAEGTTGTVVNNDAGVNHAFTIGASGVAEVMVPSNQFLNQPNVVLGKALLVYANAPVSASFLNREVYTTDMSYLLDIAALGAEYRILGWHYAYGQLQMSLTAAEDGTVATITPANVLSSGQPAGVPFQVSLNKGQSVLYTADSGNDLTGTTIAANKPLAVFSGVQCTNVPDNSGACDHIFTQLPPIEHWASEYVVPETANTGAAGNLVRILAHTDGTELTVNGAIVATLNAGAFHEIATAKDLHITANHPVLVGQFLKGYSMTGHGDPAFSYINGIGQTLKDYLFTAPTNLAAYTDNFLNLAIPTSALPSLQLNGVVVDTSAFRPVVGTGYSAGSVRIDPGPGHITADQPFLATISGFTTWDSYHTIIGASYSSGASTLNPVIAAITVATDQPVYPPHTAVQLQSDIANQGSLAASLQVVLRVTDAHGDEVVRFAPHNLGSVAAGASANHTQPWNTASYPAGTYTLIGTLLNSRDEVVGTASTLFAIAAGNVANGPRAALGLSTDRAEYAQSDLVRIDNLVRNLTDNASFDDARVELTVRNPGNAVIFTHTHELGQLRASAIRSLDVQQALRNAPVGTYTVSAVLIGSGHNLVAGATQYGTDVPLGTASATYIVVSPQGGGSGPSGTVAPIPANNRWMLLLASLLLAGTAAARWRQAGQMRARRQPGNPRGGV